MQEQPRDCGSLRLTRPERLDLKLLLRLLAVIDHGSFAGAARELNLTQQAIAFSISSLEQTLGVPLFEREKSGMVPTAYGERMKYHARNLLSEAKRAAESMVAIRSASAGRVSLGVSEALSSQVVPIALTRLLRKHPDIEVTLREAQSSRIYDLMQKGEIDLMVGAPPMNLHLGVDVEEEFLFEDSDYVLMRATHPLARETPPRLADLQPYTWIVSQSREQDQQYLCESFLVAGLEPPRHFIRSDALATGMGLLLQDDFVALTSTCVAPQLAGPGSECIFRAYRVTGLERKRRAFIRFMGGTTLSPAAIALIAEIRTVARELQNATAPGGEADRASCTTPQPDAGIAASRHRIASQKSERPYTNARVRTSADRAEPSFMATESELPSPTT